MPRTILMAVVVADADVPAFDAMSPDERLAFAYKALGARAPAVAGDAVVEGVAIQRQAVLEAQAKTRTVNNG